MEKFCFVPGCPNGHYSDRKRCKLEGGKCKSFFVPPRDPELFKMWKQRIPIGEKELSNDSLVCELHFEEDEIQQNNVENLFDGNVYITERRTPSLRPGSIPSIFPKPPEYLSQRRKTIMRNIDLFPASKSFAEKQDVQSPHENQESPNALSELFLHLLRNINSVIRPSKWWNCHTADSVIVFVRWNRKGEAERRLVLKNDLSIKVFVHALEIKVDLDVVNNINNITNLLEEIDRYYACAGSNDKSMPNCLGIIKDERKRKWCMNCSKEKKRSAVAKFRSKSLPASVLRHKLLCKKYVSEKRNRIRLEQKVSKLKTEIQSLKSKSCPSSSQNKDQNVSAMTILESL